MGGLSDFAQNTLSLSKDTVDGLKTAETVISLVPAVGGYISAGMTVLQVLGFLQAPADPLQQAVQNLIHAFDAAFTEVDQHMLMLHIADQLGPAKTSLSNLGTYTEDQLHGIRDDPTSAAFVEANQITYSAVTTLQDTAYWKRPFFQEGVYMAPGEDLDTDLGHGQFQPDDVEGGSVFDYRL
jgi:hypothetical protein